MNNNLLWCEKVIWLLSEIERKISQLFVNPYAPCHHKYCLHQQIMCEMSEKINQQHIYGCLNIIISLSHTLSLSHFLSQTLSLFHFFFYSISVSYSKHPLLVFLYFSINPRNSSKNFKTYLYFLSWLLDKK